jgi:hypothetical protein
VRSPLKMLVGKGYSWKAAKARLPPSRQVLHTIRNPRFLLSIGLLTAVVLLWRSVGSAAGEVQRYGSNFTGRHQLALVRYMANRCIQVLLLRPLQTTNANDRERSRRMARTS